MDLSDLGGLGDLAKQMQDAYSEGMGAMDQAGEQVAEDMSPDHEIELDIKLSAKIDGHDYIVDSKVTFEIELEPILQAAESPMGDLSFVLEGLNVDLGDDKDAVMEQLGQPRAIGVVKDINTRKLELSTPEGNADTELNTKGTLLATMKDDKILVNCEGVFSYPDHTDAFVAIPSMEKMQENVIIPLDKITDEVEFNWTEKDKDNLNVEGTIRFIAL